MKYLIITVFWLFTIIATAQLSILEYKTRMHYALEPVADSCLDSYSWVVDSYLECSKQLNAVEIMNDSCNTELELTEVSR